MTKVQPITNESVNSESEELREQHLTQTPIEHIHQKLSRMELRSRFCHFMVLGSTITGYTVGFFPWISF